VQGSTFVLRLNFSAKNPAHRQCVLRYLQPCEPTVQPLTRVKLDIEWLSPWRLQFDIGTKFKLWCFYFTAVSGDSNSVSYGLCERQDDNSQDYCQQPDIFSFLCM